MTRRQRDNVLFAVGFVTVLLCQLVDVVDLVWRLFE